MKKLNGPTVFFVRHGETVMNKENLLRGHDNPSLDRNGIEEAKKSAQTLSAYPLYHIYASDLQRTRQTAHIIGVKTNTAVTHVGALRPWDYGKLTGKPVNAETLATLQHYQDHPDEKVPGGESYNSFLKRYFVPVQAARSWSLKHPDKAIVLVTHSRNLYPLRRLLGEKDAPIPVHETKGSSAGMPGEESPGSVWKVEFSPDGQFDISKA